MCIFKLTFTLNLARNLSLRKLALSRNEWTNHGSGMDFDTEVSVCKTSVVDEKRWFLVGSQPVKPFIKGIYIRVTTLNALS